MCMARTAKWISVHSRNGLSVFICPIAGFMLLFVEQLLNGLQLGIMLFLMSAGLTLVFGIMQVINLAHGSFYMIGAYVGATVTTSTGSFLLGLLAALPAAALAGMLVEMLVLRRLYSRDHLDQVLATFGLIMFFNELTRILWGRQPLFMDVPRWLSGSIELIPGVPYPSYRLAVIAVGILVAVLLYLLFTRTRIGMQIRAGASNREMAGALGVNIRLLYTLVFGLGTLLAGLAGVMAGPILAVEAGMGGEHPHFDLRGDRDRRNRFHPRCPGGGFAGGVRGYPRAGLPAGSAAAGLGSGLR